jgi:NADPH-dependent curcumin reductase CurA
MPTPDDFEFVTVTIPEPSPGEIQVRNIYMSVDPYMRGRMFDRKSYAPSFQVGEVMAGRSVGQVLASKNERFSVGDYVTSMLGWREYYVSDGKGIRKVDADLVPIQAYLGTFGMPGMTAYVGLMDIGQIKEGDVVFVSAAAGAVGAVACQIAKLKGCRVIGSAGSDAKISWLMDTLGIDAAFNYKQVTNLTAELGRHAPQGVDVYFENVGGRHLQAALAQMNDFGRVVCCGMISGYNATEPSPAPGNLFLIVSKRLTLKGFIITDHLNQASRFYAEMRKWYTAGQIKWEETIIEGIENAPEAFLGLFKGENLGKMLVKLAPES